MFASRVKTALQPSRVLLDPELLPEWGTVEIAGLPLLFDQVLVPEPSQSNLGRWGLDEKRMALLAEHKIMIPVSVGNTPLRNYPESVQVTRAKILPDKEFRLLYQEAVEPDLRDGQLDEVRVRVEGNLGRVLPLDVLAFNL